MLNQVERSSSYLHDKSRSMTVEVKFAKANGNILVGTQAGQRWDISEREPALWICDKG